MQRSKLTTSLTTRTTRLAQAHTNSIATPSYPRKAVEPTLLALLLLERISSSTAMLILDLKSTQSMPSLSMPRVGRPTSAPSVPPRGSLPHSIRSKRPEQVFQDRAAIQARAYFKRNIKWGSWRARTSRSRASLRAASSHLHQQDLSTQSSKETSSSIGLQLVSMRRRGRLEKQTYRVEHQTTSLCLRMIDQLHHSLLPCPDSKMLCQRL